jgi:hypothetical protein
MSRSTQRDESVKAHLADRVILTFRTIGVPLTGARLERVKSLPAEYLYRLLDDADKQESGDRVGHFKAVDDMVQIYLNDTTAAAIRANGGNGTATN